MKSDRERHVVLVEHHADIASFKQLCTHFIQASATPTLRRLGLDRLIEDAGGLRNGIDIWTRYGRRPAARSAQPDAPV